LSIHPPIGSPTGGTWIFLLHAGKVLCLLFPLVQVFPEKVPTVLILVAIETEVFPVGSVGGIVQMIAVFVMDRELMPVFVVKLLAAFGTDQTMNLKGTLPIVTPGGGGFFQLLHDLIDGPVTDGFFLRPRIPTVIIIFHRRASSFKNWGFREKG
jgi:hypothetical protein